MGNLLNLAVYNPAILPDDDFLTGFVARNDVAANLLSRLAEVTPTSLARHHLILGQRGMGKTSLLRRLALGVRDSPQLAEVLLPLSFREEQYNVHSLHTFWLNCLDALGDWLEKNGRGEDADALDREVAAISQGSAEGEQALALLKDWARKLGRRPLLLLDNIDLILDGVADQDWTLRRVLQEAGGIVVVGATAGYLEATADPQAPFYDFFQVTVLARLGQDELLTCLRRLAEARGEAGKKVRKVIDRDPGRIRALHDLTGGNPRTLVLIYLLLELDSGSDVMSDLERLLDQVTVLYKARVEDLAPQARVVLDALALNWNPATAADLARLTKLETPAVSAQMDRLLKAGIVEKVQVSTSNRTAFQLGERFFNIWYLMRHGPRRQRTRLRWLTGFLQGFYTPYQLREQGTALLISGTESLEGNAGDYRLALGEAVGESEPGLRYLLSQSAREAMEKWAASMGKRLEDLTDPADFPAPVTAQDHLAMGWWLHIKLGRYQEAEAAYRRAIELAPNSAAPWNNLGHLLARNLGRTEEAIDAFRRASVLDPSDAYVWNVLGALLAISLSPPGESESAFRQAIALNPGVENFWSNLCAELTDMPGRYAEAVAAGEKALLLDANSVPAELNSVYLLLLDESKHTEAESRYHALLPRLDSHVAGLLTAYKLLLQDNLGAAFQALKSTLEIDPPDLAVFSYRGLLRIMRLASQRDYGNKLLSWLDDQRLSDRYWPLRAAYDAYLHGEEKLLDVNPEVRGVARKIHDWLVAPRRHDLSPGEPSARKARGGGRRKRGYT